MAGTSNLTGDESILFGDNASFDGTQRGGIIDGEGKLWIGTGTAYPPGPKIKVGNLTSPDSSVTIGYSEPDITLKAGGTVATTYIADTGSATPATNQLNLLGGVSLATVASGNTVTFNNLATNQSNMLGTSNLGMTLSGGTVTIKAADGTDLSAANPGYVRLRSNVNPGREIIVSMTSNYTFDDSAGASSAFASSLFGFNTGDSVSVNIPFYLHAVLDSNDENLIFACSRVPGRTNTLTTIYNAASGSADLALDMLALSNVTIANYQNSACLMVGAFTARINGADDWTIQSVTGNDLGFGRYAANTTFTMPLGVKGARASSLFVDNGGTAPTVTGGQYQYRIDPFSRMCSYDVTATIAGSPAGAVNALMITPLIGSPGPTISWLGQFRPQATEEMHNVQWVRAGGGNDHLTMYKDNGSTAIWQYEEFVLGGSFITIRCCINYQL